MISEIGSNFWISPAEGSGGLTLDTPCSVFGYEGSDNVWLSTGRSATKLVLQTVRERNPDTKKVVLLPPFTCHTVFEPFMAFGYEIHTFPVSMDLTTSAEDIIRLQKQTKAGVILVHRYYGFDTLPDFNDIVSALQEEGVIVIEDCTQCLYSDFKVSNADYYVGSIRKWCGVPDGGFAICKEGIFAHKPNRSDIHMVEKKRIASELKYQFIFEGKGDKLTFKSMYREAEVMLAMQDSFFSIGNLSASIQSELDTDLLKQKRRANYKFLLDGFCNYLELKAVFKYLPADVTPLYFPVFVEDREQIQVLLSNNDIYAPVVWQKAENCPNICKNANNIYERILCIPIDQRYDLDDMERIIEVLKKKI